ncbi:hypothetical protein SteCoe_16696 [Stentor coeruleus]|uniref:Uncharacterized protein n=1 Tax=Stentor coeruleus TaxID=5963 RepID=A0A1R2C0N6_9CILI|nr:hypothetical protein SteCoe_16696 [Stentor coeruleus]
MPDMILFLVYNFMGLSTFEYYSQSLGFFITLSLCITVCIGGPIIIMFDIDVYKTAMMMFAGLKTVKKEWHYVIKIQELCILLCHYFCALWLRSQDYSRSVILGVLMFVFMRLQRTYWPYLYRNDNLFMDKAYLALIFICAMDFDSYWNLILFAPLVGYFENRSQKKD